MVYTDIVNEMECNKVHKFFSKFIHQSSLLIVNITNHKGSHLHFNESIDYLCILHDRKYIYIYIYYFSVLYFNYTENI